jgi:isoquinoline 1-oxidoreductase subunit beta
VNCFAHVTADKAEIYGPTQAPEFIMQALVARLGLPKEKIHIRLARMGGGFGLRAYCHHMVEAAVISQKVNAPVKMVYTREDDMTYGIYRPTYIATFKAGLDGTHFRFVVVEFQNTRCMPTGFRQVLSTTTLRKAGK